MNISEGNGNKQVSMDAEQMTGESSTEMPRPQPPASPDHDEREDYTESQGLLDTQDIQGTGRPDEPTSAPGVDRNKLVLLGGGLLAAVLFFALTTMIGRSPTKRAKAPQPSPQAQQPGTNQPKGSMAPLMDPMRKPDTGDEDGQLTPNDIKRMRSELGAAVPSLGRNPGQPAKNPVADASLGSIPSFADTQQKWEEPQPYGEASGPNAAPGQQDQSALKESSLIFVRSQTQNQAASAKRNANDSETPLLDVSPGSRIIAKLEEQVSSADPTPVVAVVEYTYAVGDEVVIPAGARLTGHMQQVDRYGDVGVKFDEIDLGGRTEKIEAVGKGLDLGPIKGVVTGKNTGKNLLVRSVSGIGSTLAAVLGTNTSSAFSEDDLIRERLAENIGNAGDSELINTAASSHLVVSVPADTKIYVVFTKREETQPTLRKVDTSNP